MFSLKGAVKIFGKPHKTREISIRLGVIYLVKGREEITYLSYFYLTLPYLI